MKSQLPYSKEIIENCLPMLSPQERTVLALVLTGHTQSEIGRLLKYVPNRWGRKHLKWLSRSRVQQLQQQGLEHIRSMIFYTIRLDLTYIENGIKELRARKAYYDKINSDLDDYRAHQPIQTKGTS